MVIMSTIMSALLSSQNVAGKRAEDKKNLLSELHSAVKACQLKYGGRTELATESDHRVAVLCNCFEAVLSHGLRQQPTSTLKQMAELIGGSEPPSFWNFVECQLTSHERERYVSLRQIWTDRGRSRALIRASINERSLERYLHCWMGHYSLQKCYEEWAILRDPEASAMLPNLAAGLLSILFAITIDSVDLNTSRDLISNKLPKSEPIIAVPPPAVAKKATGIRHVISFDEDEHGSVSVDIANTSKISMSAGEIVSSYYSHQQQEMVEDNTVSEPSAIVNNVIETPVNTNENSMSNTQNVNQKHSADEVLDQSILSDSGMGDGHFTLADSYCSSVSSLRGSIDSEESGISPSDLIMLKLKLEEKEERCKWLETRVAELDRENQRLKQSSNSIRTTSGPPFSISIPKVHKIGSHYEYEILISSNHCNESWSLLRRYRGFYTLHKDLSKKYATVLSLDFPPKKTIGNMSSVLVEERRQRLQAYLRHLVTLLPQLGCCTTRSQLERTLTFFRPEHEI